MRDYCVITDSSCDLTQEMAEELELRVVPLSVNYKGRDYENYLDGSTLDFKEFYAGLRTGTMTSTTAPNPEKWTAAMEPVLQDGKDVLILAFSSGLSTTYNTACIAADELKEKYPEQKIYVVDTRSASLGEGLLIWHTVQKKREGFTIEQARDYAEEQKFHLCHWFTVDDLYFLKRGGRISGTAAVMGSLLQIKPVLHMDDPGHLIPMSKARGRKASIRAMAAKVAELGIEPEKQIMFISHGDCLEDAQYLEGILKEEYHVPEVRINYVGPVIGSHSGPGTLALFFLGKER